jgi:hypothetical protein
MSGAPFYSPKSRPALARVAKPGELLFEFLRGHNRFLCELRDHGGFGIEAQFYQNDEFLFSRRFDTRTLAVGWAEEERKAMIKGVV